MSKGYDYEWEYCFNNSEPSKDISKWYSKYGPRVIKRNSNGSSQVVRFSVLVSNPKDKIYLVGEFNNWGKVSNLDEYKLKNDDFNVFSFIDVNFVRHKDKYKFLVVGNNKEFMIQDPAGTYFDDFGNTVFWDYEDPNSYKHKFNFQENFNKSVKILQTDLPGLIVHFKDSKGQLGSDLKENGYYKFIAKSGVIKKIKELGYNTVQFLPFAQNIDGSNWKYRYLVPYQYSIQKNWGTPDDFSYMIDMFHKEGISVIGDFVLGHLPHKDFNIFGQSSDNHGIHLWKRQDNSHFYLREVTTWGTMRLDFDNHYVRDFFISSVIHFMKYYRIDGFRIDNIDGIIRYGPNGDGEERQNGRTFLRELNKEIYSYNPNAMINYEAHYFYEDNAKMLVSPMQSDKRALGATAYNSSRLTYYFHTEYMFKKSDEISIWRIKDIASEKEWGKSNSTVADFHNHDAAAGLMEMRCTGSYAVDSMIHGGTPINHAIGKIKVMNSIISFCCESRVLNLLQTFLLQEGSFEHDSSIRWDLENSSKKLIDYVRDINLILDNSAFWIINTKNRKFLNVDDNSKVIVVKRFSEDNEFIIVINCSSFEHFNYKVGIDSESDYELHYRSELENYSKSVHKSQKSSNFEFLDREFEVYNILPYETIVFKKIN